MKSLFLSLFILAFTISGSSQIGVGVATSLNLYDYYQNPSDDTGLSTSAGSALLNLGIGPKLWLGGQNFSISIEAQAVLGLFGFSIKDYKGLGMVSFPIMAKLNFTGASALDKEGRFGFSIGGGIQYFRTELYGITDSFAAKGGQRKLIKTYVGQIGYGFGMSGVTALGFIRLGYDPGSSAKTLSIGVQTDLNFVQTSKISDPASEL